jgi:ribose transport system substrate-binding protein
MLLLGLVALLGLLVAAGCGGDDDSSEPAAAPAVPEPEPAAPAGPDFDALQALVDAQKVVPEFEAPGEAIDPSSLAGSLIYAIPIGSSLPYARHIIDGLTEAAGFFDIEVTEFENEFDPTAWVAGVNQAIQREADAIVLVASDPSLLVPQLEEAQAAGIKVIAANNFAQGTVLPPEVDAVIDAYTNNPSHNSARLTVDFMIIDAEGAANVLIITDDAIPPSKGIVENALDEFATQCPDCQTRVINVPIADWASGLQGEVQTALVADPTITHVYPIYDGMTAGASPAIIASDSDVKIVTVDASEFVLRLMQDDDIVIMDQGYNLRQLGWSDADQTFRVLLGGPVPENNYVTSRIFDDSNVDEAGVPANQLEGYGDAYITGFRTLWGLE